MADNKVIENILTLTKCPWCGSEETAGKKAFKYAVDAGKVKDDVYPHLMPVVVQLENPQTAIGPYIMGVINYGDVCLGCGRQYSTKVDLIQIPIIAQQMPQRGMGFTR